MKSLAHIFGAALGVLVVAGVHARAEPIGWEYSWEPSSLVVAANNGGTGGISLTLQALDFATNSSDIVATNLRTFSSAPAGTPDTITDGAYTLNLSLTDSKSGRTGSMTFTGAFSGSFSTTSSNVANQFTGETTQVARLGENIYTVTIGPYAPPGPPSAANAGTISAHVEVATDPGGGGGGGNDRPGDVPEPSTLVLSFLGMSMVGAASWRKRRAAKKIA
jgi:hypothetical protein